MREMFYTIENGGYANKLFELFGKERVEKELDELEKQFIIIQNEIYLCSSRCCFVHGPN